MIPLRLFPALAVALFAGAAAVCAWHREWKLAKFYALSAAINWVMMP